MLLDCAAREDSSVLWTIRSNQSILQEINPEYSLEGLMLKLKLQNFGHLIQRANWLEKTIMMGKIEGRRIRGQQRMRWLDGITDHGHEFEQTQEDSEGQGSLVCCSPWEHRIRHEWVTEQWYKVVGKIQSANIKRIIRTGLEYSNCWQKLISTLPFSFSSLS